MFWKKSKKVDSEETVKPQPILTEWQKRHQEFLQKKLAEDAETEAQQREILAQRLAELKGEVLDKTDEEKLAQQAKKKKEKKVKEKKVKSAPTEQDLARRKARPIMVISLVTILLCLFIISPYSKQKTVKVTGLVNASQEEILIGSTIKDTDYIFSLLLNAGAYEKAVKSSSKWVKSVELTYQFPNQFTLSVTEYGVVAYTVKDGSYQPILENGVRMPLMSSSQLPENFISINLEDEKQIAILISSLAGLDDSLRAKIQSVDLAGSSSTKDLLNLTMMEGHTVRVPLSEIEQKLPYYTQIAASLLEPSLIDMEVGLYTTNAAIEEAIAQKKAEATTTEVTETSTEQSSEPTSSETTSVSE